MNLTVAEAVSLAEAVVATAGRRNDVDVALCPSYTLLHSVGETTRNSRVQLGAQDVFWEDRGAYTGQVSARMLLDAGCSSCIVGHSEKRGRFGVGINENASYFGDNDAVISRKLAALGYVGIAPILCVGETLDERERGDTEAVIVGQLEGALGNLAPQEVSSLSVAYEPVWAIGTGNVCGAEEAGRICSIISAKVAELLELEVRVVYGGSVKADNCVELFAQASIDGALVGGASLVADDFSRIILAA